MLSSAFRKRKKVFVYLLTAAVTLPLGYFVICWSMNTYSFLSLYRPEQLFQEHPDSAVPSAKMGTEILEALNAEIEQENSVKQREEGWLLARLDRLWRSVRRYVSPAGDNGGRMPAGSGPALAAVSPTSHPLPARRLPTEPLGIDKTVQAVNHVLSLSADTEGFVSTSRDDSRTPATHSRKLYHPALTASFKSVGAVGKHEGEETGERLYRIKSLKGLHTQSVIYQFNRRLALEGAVESTPVGETDSELSDFDFRTVHALNFLQDSSTPAIMMGVEDVHSGYPVSYGIGLNYQVSPLVSVRFDYSYEASNDYLLEYNGAWGPSLMTNYNKKRTDDTLSVHTFFLGLRYLYQQKATRFPLHTGFFYSTNMDDDPLLSNVSLGFSVGGGINRQDFSLGFAWRFRVWDNPEQQFPNEQEMQELETRVSNQFLFTLLF